MAPPPAKGKGWIPGAPPLAVEYADHGQDEIALKIKIKELLATGTRYVRVVRLTGPQRVEVHTKDRPTRLLSATENLTAPGILRNPIPVLALFDRKAAHRVTLRNLLQREGYEDLEAVLLEGARRGRAEGGLAARGLPVDAETDARIRQCRDAGQLDAWLARAAVADSPEAVFRT